MKKLLTCMLLLLLVTTSGYAGWKSDIATNQQRALDYISKLMYTAPNKVKRPALIRNKGWKSQRSLQEIESTMNRAEDMAKAGRADLIQLPEFKFNGETKQQRKY